MSCDYGFLWGYDTLAWLLKLIMQNGSIHKWCPSSKKKSVFFASIFTFVCVLLATCVINTHMGSTMLDIVSFPQIDIDSFKILGYQLMLHLVQTCAIPWL